MEINIRLVNSIFADQEKAFLDMKKQVEDISKKYDFFNDDDKDNFIKNPIFLMMFRLNKKMILNLTMLIRFLTPSPEEIVILKLMERNIKSQNFKLQLKLKKKLRPMKKSL